VRRLLPALAAAAVVLSGCGAADSVLERVQGSDEPAPAVATIAVLVPQNSGLARAGAGVDAAVRRAVDDSGGVRGWTVEVRTLPLDGPDLPATLETLAADDALVAVVTGFEPTDVRTTVPVLDAAGVAVVSPADSDPRHLYGADPRSQLRPWSGYSSLAVDPHPEQSALAEYLVRSARARTIVVLSDSPSSTGPVDALTQAVDQRGRARVVVVPVTERRAAAQVQEALADLDASTAVVVDGPVELAQAARAAGAGTLAFLARPDGLTPEQSAALAGAVAADRGLDPARGSDELTALLDGEGAGPYGPAAYDTGRLVVDALTRCLRNEPSSSPSRSRCKAEVAGSQWTGLTGPVVFDEYGGRLGLLPDVLVLDDKGRWSLPGEAPTRGR
jgi:ABC-type branched-subunit amino acid transport system substrate-binding protein